METTLLLLSIVAKTPASAAYISLHSMCRQDVAEPTWAYFVMHDDTTFTVLTQQQWLEVGAYFGLQTRHTYGTTATSSVEHIQLLIELETV